MERIRLTKDEKTALRNLALGEKHWSDGIDARKISLVFSSLEYHGLVRVAWGSGGEAVAAKLTIHGRAYLASNPKLRNPLFSGFDDSGTFAAAVSIACAIVSIAVLVYVCKAKGVL